MAYRITYNDGNIRNHKVQIKKIKWRPLVVGAAAVALAVTLSLPAGRLWLRDLILPGDEEITAGALENLAENLENGVAIGEAVEVFCNEIIHGKTY